LLSDVPDWLVALTEKGLFLSLAVRRRGTRPRLAPSGRRKDALGRWTTWRSSSVSSAGARLLGAWPHSGRSRAHRRRLELAMSLLRERAPA